MVAPRSLVGRRRTTLLAALPLTLVCLLGACSVSGTPQQDSAGGAGPSASSAVAPSREVPTMVVLDASGSMTTDDAPGQRFSAAQEAVTSLAGSLSPGHPLGLTVYGTGTGNTDAEKQVGCRDIRTVVPVGPLDRTRFAAAVDDLRPRGYTPIGASLTKAAAALPSDGKRAIVLVSDGIDTCAPPKPCDVARQLHEQDPDLSISTVGFRVDGDAQTQLQCIAEATGGIYLDASAGPLLTSRLAALFDPGAVARSLQPSEYRGVELGMSVDEVSRVADANLDQVPATGRFQVRYVDCTLVFDDGEVSEIRSASEDLPTVDGVRVGDPVSTVLDLYGSAYDASTPGRIVVAADPVGGTGYVFGYRGDDPSARSAPVTTITLCTCAPTLGTGMVAFDGVDPGSVQVTGERGATLWNGEQTVAVQLGGDDTFYSAEAVGFVAGQAVYVTRSGAHGYIDKIRLVDPASGRESASVPCFTCEVQVADGRIVAANGFEGWIRRYDADLEQVDQIDVDKSRFAYFDGNDDAAGDPPPRFHLLASTSDAFWVEGADPGTSLEQAFTTARVHRIDTAGRSVATSGTVMATSPGILSDDRSTLTVPNGDGSFAMLDAVDLTSSGETSQVTQDWHRASSTDGADLVLVGGTCLDAGEECPAADRPGVSRWDGDAWRTVGPTGALCVGDLGDTRIQAVTTFDEVGEPQAQITSTTGEGDPRVLATTGEASCVVDVPATFPPSS